MAWNLEGTYFESCSCEVVCPCTASMALGADYDRCRVTLVFNVARGDVDGTDVGGVALAVVADTPKVMTDGNGRLGVFIDAAASDEQAEKLGAVFTGQLGGPMAALGPLVGEVLGVERAKIDVQDDGIRHSVRIGDAVDFEIEDIVPFGVETGQPVRFNGMFHPVASDLTIAEAKRSRHCAHDAALSSSCSRSEPRAGGGAFARCRGWTWVRGPSSGRSGGSSES